MSIAAPHLEQNLYVSSSSSEQTKHFIRNTSMFLGDLVWRITCQRLTNDRIVRCIIAYQFCIDDCVSVIFVLCFDNFVLCFKNIVLCFKNCLLCLQIWATVDIEY